MATIYDSLRWDEDDPELPDDIRLGYMCKIDFECELSNASGGNRVFPSVADLKNYHTCVDSCGIVEVEVRMTRVIQEEQFPEEDLI